MLNYQLVCDQQFHFKLFYYQLGYNQLFYDRLLRTKESRSAGVVRQLHPAQQRRRRVWHHHRVRLQVPRGDTTDTD